MFIIVLFYFSFRLITINIDVVGENGRGIRSITSRERMKYLWHLFLYKKKAKYSVGYGTPITCASPSTKNDSRGEKNCTHSQTISFVLSLSTTIIPLPRTASLTFSISSLWNSYMFLYIYYIYIYYTRASRRPSSFHVTYLKR